MKTIDVTTTLNFDFDVKAGDYSMVYALTEDGITGVKQLTYLPGMVDQNMSINPGSPAIRLLKPWPKAIPI